MTSHESASFPLQENPDWQSKLQSAMEETNLTCLFKKIEEAEAAIQVRREVLSQCLDNSREWHQLELALASLRKMKAKVLKFR